MAGHGPPETNTDVVNSHLRSYKKKILYVWARIKPDGCTKKQVKQNKALFWLDDTSINSVQFDLCSTKSQQKSLLYIIR